MTLNRYSGHYDHDEGVIKHELDDQGSWVHIKTAESLQKDLAEAQGLAAQAAKLREALELAEVEVYLAKTWCRVCRTEGLGDLRSREAHPHARECLLYKEDK